MALFTPGPRTFASPFVDGKIAINAGEAYRTGNFAKVPMMIGATSADIGGCDVVPQPVASAGSTSATNARGMVIFT